MKVGHICQRGNYFPPKEYMDLASGVVFLVSVDFPSVNVSHWDSVEEDRYTHQNVGHCFELEIWHRGGRQSTAVHGPEN